MLVPDQMGAFTVRVVDDRIEHCNRSELRAVGVGHHDRRAVSKLCLENWQPARRELGRGQHVDQTLGAALDDVDPQLDRARPERSFP